MREPRFSDHEIAVARKWWDERGRHLVSKQFNGRDTESKFRTGGPAPAVKTTSVIEGPIPSGILNGLLFDELTRDEAQRVVYVWRYMNDREKYPERINERDERHIKRLHLQ